MYPVIRFIHAIIHSSWSKTISMDSTCETTFRCMPWDLDLFFEMNNGRILTLYDLGRFDLSIRTGFAKVLKAKRWGLVVAGSSVRYRQRVKMFDKVTIRTYLASFEDRWIYIVQSMWVMGKPTSSVLLRTGVTGKGKVISIEEVLNACGISDWKPEPSVWVKSWITSEEDRPWPPG